MLRGRMCTFRHVVTGSAALPEKLSYASINWIRFKGSPSRAVSGRPLASQPPVGAPLAGAKLVQGRAEVNHARDLRGTDV